MATEIIEFKLPMDMYEDLNKFLAKYEITIEEAVIQFFKETVRLGRIPFDYTREDLEEARRLEVIMDDDLRDE